VSGGRRLHYYAADVGRAPDGSWQVLTCRSQGPSGLGYVLHNRLVISRQVPDAFRELRVQHIASSYRRLLDSIERPARAVAGGVAPRVVLLTPGPYAETYFEHAYLSRYLGLPLVEGGDLVVREQRLYLKTVEGLEPVHGMLRRLDDDWCDPLELRPDSALGVPGLLQAARARYRRVVARNLELPLRQRRVRHRDVDARTASAPGYADQRREDRGPSGPAVLDVQHGHDGSGETADDPDRQVDLAEEQHQHDARGSQGQHRESIAHQHGRRGGLFGAEVANARVHNPGQRTLQVLPQARDDAQHVQPAVARGPWTHHRTPRHPPGDG
jgi:hypothetical protein